MSAERHIKRINLSAEADFAVSDILSMYSGVVPTPLPPFSRLGAPVASHAGMLMLPLFIIVSAENIRKRIKRKNG